MEQQIFVFYANPYKFTDENGVLREGVSVNYLNSANLNPVVNANGTMGLYPCKQSLGLEKIPKLKAVPGWYTGHFSMMPRAGKNVLQLVDLDPVPVGK